MRTIFLNYYIKFGLCKSSLIKLSCLTIKNRNDSVIASSISHINIAFQISQQQTVLLFGWELSHHKMLVIRMHGLRQKSQKLYILLLLIYLPGIRMYSHNFMSHLLSHNTNERTVYQITYSSTNDVQSRFHLIQSFNQLANLRSINQLRIIQYLCRMFICYIMLLEQPSLNIVQFIYIKQFLGKRQSRISFIWTVCFIVLHQLASKFRINILVRHPHSE